MVGSTGIAVLEIVPATAWDDEGFQPEIYKMLAEKLRHYAESYCMMVPPTAMMTVVVEFKRIEGVQFVNCLWEQAEFVQIVAKTEASW